MIAEPSRWLDLVSEMQAAVWEEAPLHEITLGTVEWSRDGQIVRGPWSAAECQSVLLPALAAGWLELIADVEPPTALARSDWQSRTTRDRAFLILSTADATELLNDPSRWVLGTADGHAMLSRKDEGEAHQFSDWLDLARQAK